MRIISTLSRGAGVAGALLLASGPAALAATGAGSRAGTGENTPLNLTVQQAHHHVAGSGMSIVRTLIALVVVIGLIYAIARILKAVKGREQRPSGDGLTQLATLPLGPNKSIALVRSGQDIVLVGIADTGVTPIKTYTEAEAIASGVIPATDALATTDEAATPSFGTFVESLRRMTVRT